ncbi:glycosyltransferase [Halothiobacillus sp.]|uniref:glycosyltransferase n=1 Tax=Halothiobacillus sp. TaxID=1891311 RepID=UPI002623F322|nr:glycosyltransferase [Halothiobacillus sp.]MDD4966413.1 glycosyltransferase [Halothiobacillus sp.]
MHILMISDVYFPRINGVSTSIQSFRSELIASGHRVTLICPDYPESITLERAKDQHDDEDILRLPSRKVLLDPEDRMMSYGAIINLLPILRGRTIDIVHIHTPFVAHYAGVKLARKLAIPVVESYHTFFEEYLYNYVRWAPRNWLKWAARFFSKSQCNAVDALVVPSSPMRDALQTYGVRTGMHIIPTGLNLDTFHTPPTSDFRAKLSIRDDQPILLYVGRVALEKNIDFLLNMMPFVLKETPEAILVIAGEGPAESHLQRKVAAMGLQASVKFVGYMRRDGALQDAYRAADLFVFASRTETQGLVLLEALALGTPVVALGAMGTLDVLNPDGGCMIAPDDPSEFAEAVNQTLNQPDRYQQLVDQAPRYAETWTAAQKTQQLLEMYRQQLASHTTS